MRSGWFYVLPEINARKLESLFRHKVFKMLLREKKITRKLVEAFPGREVYLKAPESRPKLTYSPLSNTIPRFISRELQ